MNVQCVKNNLSLQSDIMDNGNRWEDAPYLKYEKYYPNEFGWDDYVDMAKLLAGIAGKYMVFHSYDKRVNELFMTCRMRGAK